MKQILFVGLYLVAIVAANLLTATFGPGISIVNAFVLIALDLVSRDNLHDLWKTGKWWKLGLLIGTGSLLSWLFNKDAGQIAVAPLVAFAAAGAIDTITYHFLRKYPYLIKCNGSNLFSALTDSIVFPTIAFGGFTLWVTLGQFVAKVAGGFIWSLIWRKLNVVAPACNE